MTYSHFPMQRVLSLLNLLQLVVTVAFEVRFHSGLLDILCGDYRRAIVSNSDAIRADEKFAQRSGAMNFYTLYRSHDYHFRIYAAMFAGMSQVAFSTVAALEKSISEELLRVRSPPMADWVSSASASQSPDPLFSTSPA